MRRTPLYGEHVSSGARMTDFGGWEMPLQYKGIIEEHRAVREAAGLFDVSHMGEVEVRGGDAFGAVQNLVTNDVSAMRASQALYSPMCYPDGGTVDDVVVYMRGEGDYLIIVNAANTKKDFEWISANARGAQVRDVSDEYAQIALQGPRAQDVLKKLTDYPVESLGFFRFADGVAVAGRSVMLSRSGYTGEDGFEIYSKPEDAPELWRSLTDAGKEFGLLPAGLGARDTLRFEAALPLYGHELSENISPLEAGLGRFVKLGKDSFIGKEALLKQSEKLERAIAGFEAVSGVPRNGFEVFARGARIGFVTSGSFSPTLKKSLGMALIEKEYSAQGTEIEIFARGRNVAAKVVKLPFYTKKYKR